MTQAASLDSLVRNKLRQWPQRPPGLPDYKHGNRSRWLKARPGDIYDADHPLLKAPGARRMRTVPDGLWLCFGGKGHDAYVDVFVIEICGTFANLLDKRSRFSPSMQSLLAVCPARWLAGSVSCKDSTPRWKHAGLDQAAALETLVLPVRDIRVLYSLRPRHFETFIDSQIPHAHEYFVPVTALLAPEGWRQPNLQAFIARAAANANVWNGKPYPNPPAADPSFAP